MTTNINPLVLIAAKQKVGQDDANAIALPVLIHLDCAKRAAEVAQSGVYLVRMQNGHTYVGSAVNFRKRWNCHRQDLRRGRHHNKIMQDSFNKYGESSLIFEKVLLCPRDLVVMYEQLAIDALNPNANFSRVAGSKLGCRLSEATKDKIRKAAIGRAHSDEAKARMSASIIGRVHSIESRKKISAANTGKIRSEEHSQNIRIANTGKLHTEEHKRKIGLAGRGRTWSDDTRKARAGITHSEETKAKMSETQKQRWAKRRAEGCV